MTPYEYFERIKVNSELFKGIRCLALDRDGLIIENSTNPESSLYYIRNISDVKLKDGTIEFFQKMKEIVPGFPIILQTRQRGLDKGLLTWDEFHEVNMYIQKLIGWRFTDIYCEPKAKTKLHIYGQILNDFSKFQPSEILIIDDSPEHIDIAQVLGMRGYCTDSLKGLLDF